MSLSLAFYFSIWKDLTLLEIGLGFAPVFLMRLLLRGPSLYYLQNFTKDY